MTASLMKKNNITEQYDWEKYWKLHHEIRPLKEVYFEKYLKSFPAKGSLIELGGFPGHFAAYSKQRFNYDVTILDYVITPETVRHVEALYNLEEGAIKTIKADIFCYENLNSFDIVTSFGFIEHFEDTKLLIKKHIDFLKPGGILLATLPNFRGLNGFVQKYFDPKNYSMHNIKSMDINILRGIMEEINLSYYKVSFIGSPTIWLEPDAPVTPLIRKSLLLLAKILHKCPFKNNRLFAPYIIILGIK